MKYHDRTNTWGSRSFRLLPFEDLRVGDRFWFAIMATPAGPWPIAMSPVGAAGGPHGPPPTPFTSMAYSLPSPPTT